MSAGTGSRDNSEKLLGMLFVEPAEPTVESGTAVQNMNASPLTYNFVIKGKAAGKIQVGPKNTVASYELPIEIPASKTDVIDQRIPAGWWVKVTLTEGSITKTVTTL
jgi:hypothetical protein